MQDIAQSSLVDVDCISQTARSRTHAHVVVLMIKMYQGLRMLEFGNNPWAGHSLAVLVMNQLLDRDESIQHSECHSQTGSGKIYKCYTGCPATYAVNV